MGAISCLRQKEQIVSVLQMCLLHKVSASPEVPVSQGFCPKIGWDVKQQPLTVCQEGKGRVRFTIKHQDTNMNLAKRVLIKYKIKANSIFVAKFLRGSAAKMNFISLIVIFASVVLKGGRKCAGISSVLG